MLIRYIARMHTHLDAGCEASGHKRQSLPEVELRIGVLQEAVVIAARHCHVSVQQPVPMGKPVAFGKVAG
jgi:hypothetical protein